MSGGTAAQTGELPVASTRPRELARTRELPLRGGRARRPAAVAAQTGELPVGAVAPTLADLERALCRDRSNVVIAAPPSAERSVLVKALPRRLEGPLRVVSVVLGDVSEDRLEATLLGALASTSAPGAEPPERLLELARELERGGSALLVVVEDAEGLTPPVLARLGELSRASRGLRLALFAGPGGPGDDGFFARLVAALGVGAQKIELPTRPGAPPASRPSQVRREDAPVRRPAREGPRSRPESQPAAPPRRARLERVEPAAAREDISVTQPGASRAARRSGAFTLAAFVSLGLALAVFGGVLGPRPPQPPEPSGTVPGSLEALGQQLVAESLARAVAPAGVPTQSPSALWNGGTVAPRIALPPPALRATSLALPVALPTPKPAALPDPPRTPPRGSDAGSHDPPAPGPPAARPEPAPPPTSPPAVTVSINATPWARIEVDGRNLGLTPLGNVRLRAGAHRFRAHLPDGVVVERTVEIDAHRNHIAFP